MKQIISMAASLMLLGASMAAAQSLGDYARAARQAKPQTASTSHHYDNDNLPRTDHLSVVGPEAAANTEPEAAPAAPAANAAAEPSAPPANASASADAPKPAVKDAKAPVDDHRKAMEALQKKLEEKKQKIEALSRELDLSQREYRLRVAAIYSDAGYRLRNAAQWDKEEAQYKQDTAEKQKALEAARQDLEVTQEEARKAGLKQKDPE